MGNTTYMLLFSANLVFIITHLYGWMVKWFYRPKAYVEHFNELFPAQRAVGLTYLLQVFELPYLLQIGDPDALLYVNAFSLLSYTLLMLVMCEKYFYPTIKRKPHEYLVLLPAVVVLLPLFLQAIGVVKLRQELSLVLFILITVIFAFYFWLSVRMALKIGRDIKKINEASYADVEDFPVRLAGYLQWVPTGVCVLLLINFYLDNVWVKFARDILFILASIGFLILTLNPWRKIFSKQEEEIIGQVDKTGNRLSEARCSQLSAKLDKLLNKDHIFTESHITIDILMQKLVTNANYVAEVIRRSGYLSFYDMICQHRVRHAIALIHQNPDEKLIVIAEQCGFSSASSMTKAFKQQGKEPPSHYKTS